MENRSRIRAATDGNQSPADYNRRQALKAAGRIAAYMTPAMTVLLKGTPADACHKPGSVQSGAKLLRDAVVRDGP